MARSGEVRFALINGRRQLEPSGPKTFTTRDIGALMSHVILSRCRRALKATAISFSRLSMLS
jgi:hypothetical protein